MNNASPLVSIMMPAYNASAFITEAIQSVILQEYPAWELIIVDDGSTDNTLSIAVGFAALDKRIRVCAIQNSGQGAARNKAIAQATGDLFAFLDADDYWHKSKLQKQVTFLLTTNSDVVFADAWIVKDDATESKNTLGAYAGILQGNSGMNSMLASNKIPILTVLSKKKPLLDAGGFSENRTIQNAEDYHLWLKMLQLDYTFQGMGVPLAYYRIHAQASTSNDRSVFFPICYALQDLARRCGKYTAYYHTALQHKLLHWMKQNMRTGHPETNKAIQLYMQSLGRKVPLLGQLPFRRFLPNWLLNRLLLLNDSVD